MKTVDTTLGELIHVLYEEFLSLYGDEDLASVATAATVNEYLADATREEPAEARREGGAEAA